jgi:hypothetical protein
LPYENASTTLGREFRGSIFTVVRYDNNFNLNPRSVGTSKACDTRADARFFVVRRYDESQSLESILGLSGSRPRRKKSADSQAK